MAEGTTAPRESSQGQFCSDPRTLSRPKIWKEKAFVGKGQRPPRRASSPRLAEEDPNGDRQLVADADAAADVHRGDLADVCGGEACKKGGQKCREKYLLIVKYFIRAFTDSTVYASHLTCEESAGESYEQPAYDKELVAARRLANAHQDATRDGQGLSVPAEKSLAIMRASFEAAVIPSTHKRPRFRPSLSAM